MKASYVRWLGHIEAWSLIILVGIAMPLKYLAEIPGPTRVLGTVHGCLFIMYVIALTTGYRSLGLTFKQLFSGLVLACVPFGPFVFDSQLRKASLRVREDVSSSPGGTTE